MERLTENLIISLFIFAFLLALNPYSDPENDIEEMLKQASERIESADEDGAMSLYNEILEEKPDQMEALWNLSVLYAQRGFRTDNSSDQESDYESADKHADKCLEAHPEKAPCHFAKALVVGRIADISGTRDRIRKSGEVKEHADKAIELDPEFYRTYHLLGVWHSEVANLSRSERMAARTFFGGLPEGASNEESEKSFKKALEMNPESILIHLDFARHYQRTGEDEKAIELLEKIGDLEPKLIDDEKYKEEAQELLNELT